MISSEYLPPNFWRTGSVALMNGWRHTFLDLQPDDNQVSVPLGESLAAVYLVSQDSFDDAVPIRIDPAPRELVRVGLGYEYLNWECDIDSGSGYSGE